MPHNGGMTTLPLVLLALQGGSLPSLVVPQAGGARLNVPRVSVARTARLTRAQVGAIVQKANAGSEVDEPFTLSATRLTGPGKAVLKAFSPFMVDPEEDAIVLKVPAPPAPGTILGDVSLVALSLPELKKGASYVVVFSGTAQNATVEVASGPKSSATTTLSGGFNVPVMVAGGHPNELQTFALRAGGTVTLSAIDVYRVK